MSTFIFEREIPVRKDVDVMIAGGGPSGIASALAAAKQGKTVYLAESHSCLGGMGTAGLVPVMMQFGDGVNFLADGIGRIIYDTALEQGAAFFFGNPDPDFPQGKKIHHLHLRSEALKRVYDELLITSGAEFSFHTQTIGVEKDGSRVMAAVCSGKSGLFAVKAKVFIDCTGDGDMAAQAGAPFEKGDVDGNLMPGSLCSLWADVDWERVKDIGRGVHKYLPLAFKDGIFSIQDLHLPGMYQTSTHAACGNLVHTFGVDGTDEDSLTRALIDGRKRQLEYSEFYRKYIEGFERADLIATASLLGVRETRRIMGDYLLNLEDYRARAVFDDEIGRYCYPIDLHPSHPDPKEYAEFEEEFRGKHLGTGESYGIPYRTLTPRGLDNLLVAGRCISVDRSMQASIRVMPGCFITGQAAGTAAAMIAESDAASRSLDVKELQRRLKKVGAYLPNS